MNLLPTIVKDLHLHLEEVFSLADPQFAEHESNKYKFTEDNLYFLNNEQWTPSELLAEVLNGNISITLPVYKPVCNEIYYTIEVIKIKNRTVVGEDNIKKKGFWTIKSMLFTGSFEELVLRQQGLCFRTEEEAKDALPKVYEMLTGIPWVTDKEGI